MVTGYEMEYPEFLRLASSVTFLHLDFHSLALGRDDTGLRYPRVRSNASDWCRHAQIVQMNRRELDSVCPGMEPEKAVKEIYSWGPRWVAVTDGSLGVYIAADGIATHVPATNPTENPVDPTGCGDAFGAGLFAGALRGKPIMDATVAAELIARRNADFKNIPPPGAYTGWNSREGDHI